MGEAQGSCIQGEVVSVQIRNGELFIVPTNERGDRNKEGGVSVLPLGVLRHSLPVCKVCMRTTDLSGLAGGPCAMLCACCCPQVSRSTRNKPPNWKLELAKS